MFGDYPSSEGFWTACGLITRASKEFTKMWTLAKQMLVCSYAVLHRNVFLKPKVGAE
jgi:hypothetical protein